MSVHNTLVVDDETSDQIEEIISIAEQLEYRYGYETQTQVVKTAVNLLRYEMVVKRNSHEAPISGEFSPDNNIPGM